MEWYLKVLKQYVDFSGRARRKEYWMFVLFNLIVSIGLTVIDSIIGTGGILGGLYMLGVLLPSLGVAIRRLHDTNRSGWWLLICLVPLVGTIILIVFLVQDGSSGENNFGADPKLA